MEPLSWLSALLKRAPLAIAVLGAAVFILGAAGGFEKLKIADPIWQTVVAVGGGCIFCLGIFLLLREDKWAKHYGLRITNPIRGDEVDAKFNVSGIYKTKPPAELHVRLFVFSPASQQYWINQAVGFYEEGNWKVCSVGVGGKQGDEKRIGIALVGKEGQALCGYYDEVAKQIRQLRVELKMPDLILPGIPKLTKDFKIVHEIPVKRK
jgi:hypothetical protein